LPPYQQARAEEEWEDCPSEDHEHITRVVHKKSHWSLFHVIVESFLCVCVHLCMSGCELAMSDCVKLKNRFSAVISTILISFTIFSYVLHIHLLNTMIRSMSLSFQNVSRMFPTKKGGFGGLHSQFPRTSQFFECFLKHSPRLFHRKNVFPSRVDQPHSLPSHLPVVPSLFPGFAQFSSFYFVSYYMYSWQMGGQFLIKCVWCKIVR
jgi:hypothetical protein